VKKELIALLSLFTVSYQKGWSLSTLGAVSKIVLYCPSLEQGGVHEITRNGNEKNVSCEFVDRLTWQEDLKIADTL
jgi:hypothetical protein